MIEKVIGETNGKVFLAKVNVDENPQVSQAFQVQSIPAVYALVNGQVVDGFMGAQPEAALREFVNKLIAGELDEELASLVSAGDEASLQQALEIDPTHRPAAVAMARILIGSGRSAEALTVLDPVESDDEIEMLVEMARQSALPDDAKAGIEQQLGQLLGQVKGDEDARMAFIELLDELGVGDPDAAAQWRKKLSTQLF